MYMYYTFIYIYIYVFSYIYIYIYIYLLIYCNTNISRPARRPRTPQDSIPGPPRFDHPPRSS